MSSRQEFEEQMAILQGAVKEVEDENQNLNAGHASALEPLAAAGKKVYDSAQACQEWTG